VVIRGDNGQTDDFAPVYERLAGILDPSYFGSFSISSSSRMI
jgi:hypothetical protein